MSDGAWSVAGDSGANCCSAIVSGAESAGPVWCVAPAVGVYGCAGWCGVSPSGYACCETSVITWAMCGSKNYPSTYSSKTAVVYVETIYWLTFLYVQCLTVSDTTYEYVKYYLCETLRTPRYTLR